MKRQWPFSFLVGGVFLWIFGLIYNIAFAGIPYPDPTPEQAEDFAFHSQIAVAIFWSGLGVFVFGLVGFVVRLIKKVKNKNEDIHNV